MQQPSEQIYQMHLKGLLLLLLLMMMTEKAGGSTLTPETFKDKAIKRAIFVTYQGLGHGLKTARLGLRRTPLT